MTTPRRKTSKLTWAVLAAMVLFLTFCAWGLFFPHTFETTHPLDRAAANSHSPIDLPPAAHEIMIATHSHWIQHVAYLKFEMPPADCLAFAKSIFPGVTPSAIQYHADYSTPRFNPSNAFRDLTWFDIDHIKHGWIFGQPGPSTPVAYMDTDRGIFYYRSSD